MIGVRLPIEFMTSLQLDLLYASWSGRVTIPEFKKNYFDYISDVNFRNGRTELVDLSDVIEVDFNFRTLSDAVAFVNAESDAASVRTRTIILAPNEGIFGLGRMYQQLADFAGGIVVELYVEETLALEALALPFKTIPELLAGGGFLPACPKSVKALSASPD